MLLVSISFFPFKHDLTPTLGQFIVSLPPPSERSECAEQNYLPKRQERDTVKQGSISTGETDESESELEVLTRRFSRRLTAKRPQTDMDEPSESSRSKRYRTTAKLGSISAGETDESDLHEEFTRRWRFSQRFSQQFSQFSRWFSWRLAAKRPQTDVDEPSGSGRSKRDCAEPLSEDASDKDNANNARYFYAPVSGIDIPGNVRLIVYLLRNVKTAAIEIGCVMLSHSDLGDMIRGMTGNSAPHACSARSGVQQRKGRAVLSKEAPFLLTEGVIL